jgi:hypothetical protein
MPVMTRQQHTRSAHVVAAAADGGTCVLCQYRLDGADAEDDHRQDRQVYVLPNCRHTVHTECMVAWLRTGTQHATSACPVCHTSAVHASVGRTNQLAAYADRFGDNVAVHRALLTKAMKDARKVSATPRMRRLMQRIQAAQAQNVAAAAELTAWNRLPAGGVLLRQLERERFRLRSRVASRRHQFGFNIRGRQRNTMIILQSEMIIESLTTRAGVGVAA